MQGGAGSSWMARSKGTPCQLFLAQELRRGIRRGVHECSLSLRHMDGPPVCEVPAGGEPGARDLAVAASRCVPVALFLALRL